MSHLSGDSKIDPKRLAGYMKNTFFSFFSKFGNFNQMQLKTIPHILRGENVVLVSGTGSGKTRALVAPIVEVLIRENKPDDLFLYISPTKALVNDTYKRLVSVFENLHIGLTRKTGDFPFNETRMKEAKGIIITLEGVDSLLTAHSGIFKRVRFVLCDEVHLVDNTPRGDHLRILLQRIKHYRKLTNKKINFHISSATIYNVQELANRYFKPNKILIFPGGKKIELTLHQSSSDVLLFLERQMREQKLTKCLIFCNSRKSAENVARSLKKVPFFHPVYTHHASLSKKEREHVEASINYNKRGTCTATMTLELGIDIGDIDLIVLNGPPPNVSSFLQRIGRGCRRRTDRKIVVGWYHSPYEKLLFELFEYLASTGDLSRNTYHPRYSISIQQLFSMGKEFYEEGLTKEHIITILKPLVPEYLIISILKHVIIKDYFYYRNNRYFCRTSLSDRIAEHTIYSNISTSAPMGEVEVRNIVNNSVIGFVSYTAAFKGNRILLAGKEWEVEKSKGRKVFVNLIRNRQKGKTYFQNKDIRDNFSYYLATNLKEKLCPDLCNTSKILLLISPKHPERVYIFHFLGTIFGILLANQLKGAKDVKKILAVNGIFIYCENLDLDHLFSKDFSMDKTDLINLSFSDLVPFLNLGPYFNFLPDSIQTKNVESSIDFIKYFDILETSTIEFAPERITIKLLDAFGLLN